MDTTIEVTPPERQTVMKLADGRSLAWYEWGPADGTPVLFCTGAAMSGSLGFGTDCVSDLGLRLIAPDRPGLGLSSPHPQKTLLTWVDDTRQLIEHLHLKDVLTVGFSQGAPFAYALAGSGLASAAAIVSGQDQFSHPWIRPLLNPEVRQMISTLEPDPKGFEDYITETVTVDRLWDLIIGMSGKRDLLLYESPNFSRAYRQSLEQGFSQGSRGYARDLVIAWGEWPVAPEDISIPVDLWYGLQDTSTVHSPDFGKTMASRLQRASRRAPANEGGSILWTRACGILERLKLHTVS